MDTLSSRLVQVLREIGELWRRKLDQLHFREDGTPFWQGTRVGASKWEAEYKSARRRLNHLLADLQGQGAPGDLVESVVASLEAIAGDKGTRPGLYDEVLDGALHGREAVARELDKRIAAMIAAGELLEAEAATRPRAKGEANATADLIVPAAKPEGSRKGIGGRPRLSAKEAKRRTIILKAWARAKGARVRQKDFCRDNNLTTSQLGKCVAWQAQKNRRSGTP